MKKLLLIFVVVVFAGLTYLNNSGWGERLLSKSSSPASEGKGYRNGILENTPVPSVANYKIKAELIPSSRTLNVSEEMTWINKTGSLATEIMLHLYPNAFRNSRTQFFKGRESEFSDDYRSGIVFKDILLGDKKLEMQYVHTESLNPFDSTVARVALDRPVNPGDSVTLKFTYRMPVPKSLHRFGYAAGRDFYFISQWFIKAGVFTGKEWICSEYHPFTNFFADFGNYEVQITLPDKYSVAAAGVESEKKNISGGRTSYSFRQSGIHDFAWMASDNIIYKSTSFLRGDKSRILIKAYVQPENEKYLERYIKAVENSLSFFERYIGPYPYRTITLVDLPKTSRSRGMEYPGLITVRSDLFSPLETLSPEMVTIHEFTHQYFYGMVANNEVYEAWLDEGLASYLTGKILNHYYGKALINFKLFGYYPVFGLDFLSYSELPLVYTLGRYPVPEGMQALAGYYRNPSLSAIADTSYKLPDTESYSVSGYYKPELMLISLERYLGREKVLEILKDFFNTYRFTHPEGKDFISTVAKHSGEDMGWFFRNLYSSSSTFDYRIDYVKTTGNSGEYEVMAERLGDGAFKEEVALYTEKDTLFQKWNGEERWKKMIFRTRNKVIGAEIDPFRKNIMDLNYANNSYLIHEQYGGSMNLSVRWLFWIQNLLLIISSIA
ncbi:MAG: M1 family metallopeptidase [Ignavibacteria bacterium]|nr:M1 family metallopeptidase [Ignavibacteria bacterium]MCU7502460.1 M1 family metallopeptidase [Ignavibacteria bacterium]MCU7514975.1 M1 family metallopeptidase [Ignavibacteria bacterium]